MCARPDISIWVWGNKALNFVRHILLIAISLALSGFGGVSAQIAGSSEAAGLEQCVEETGFMRKNHMEVLLHQRDSTMREGIRTPDHSLVECVSCHAGRDDDGKFVPVNAEGQFCAGCHKKAAVDIDCFQCHATRPDPEARSTAYPVSSTIRLATEDLYSLRAD